MVHQLRDEEERFLRQVQRLAPEPLLVDLDPYEVDVFERNSLACCSTATAIVTIEATIFRVFRFLLTVFSFLFLLLFQLAQTYCTVYRTIP